MEIDNRDIDFEVIFLAGLLGLSSLNRLKKGFRIFKNHITFLYYCCLDFGFPDVHSSDHR
ncbi:hypothetical protein SAMN05444371_2755 [Epilithonimonas mollis]|uniref:Uncharacterized protein n=1 Tax=Epilithonimonas mollis TaxID=216903 RepID=A0A1M6TAN3_9FLAO|nr:hypothetical protein SAMN05444371_2755 [Epilithonimonas mollis]